MAARLLAGLRPWACRGVARDQLITLTEGVLVHEEREGPVTLPDDQFEVSTPAPDRLLISIDPSEVDWLRLGVSWPLLDGERVTGLGARHGLDFDQRGRLVRLGADRRYTGPDCPPEFLEQGGIPQGDYAPVPWLLSSAGWAAWIETSGPGVEADLTGDVASLSVRSASGPLRVHVFTGPTPGGPAARLPPRDRHARADARVGLRPLEEPRRLRAPGRRRGRLARLPESDLPLDAIVIDSPWETQYNTWRFNPHQFPDAPGLVKGMREDGVRTVVWVTPWVNLESIDGQRPPDAESERLHAEPAENYAEGAEAGHYVKAANGDPYVGRWWMGTGSIVDFTSAAARDWWRELSRNVFELGVEGVKADDGEGYYFPPDAELADGRLGVQAAWEYGRLYRETTQQALDDVHGEGRGVVFGRSGWTGQQATGMLWGGDQASDFWSLRALLTSLLTCAATGFSNLSHDVGGYLGRRLAERCEPELLVRWAQLGALTPLMQAHGRFQQEAWTYDGRVLDDYREAVLLHERLVPYIRAAAATAARSGLPIMRPLCLVDPEDPEGWAIPDAYMFGPSLWVAPVLEEGATERRTYLPRGEWLDWWTGEPLDGRPLDRRRCPARPDPALGPRRLADRHLSGETTSPAGSARRTPPARWRQRSGASRPWGTSSAHLADGTRIAWRHGEWSVSPTRPVSFLSPPGT